jgi:RNase P subunit RPR2
VKKKKYIDRVTEDRLQSILEQKYPQMICPECNKSGVYAASIITDYDEDSEEEILLSFTVFCKECGGVLGTWDNTGRQSWFK